MNLLLDNAGDFFAHFLRLPLGDSIRIITKIFNVLIMIGIIAGHRTAHTHHIGIEKVLPIAAIYGANASGKSNVIEAFEFMLHYVLYSFGFGGDGSGKREGSRAIKTRPFLLDQESLSKESSFEVYFTQKSAGIDRVYNYGFSILQNEIIEEWLNYKAKASKGNFKRVFYRNRGTIEFEDIGERQQENIRIALEKETLILSLGAKLKVKRLKEVRDVL